MSGKNRTIAVITDTVGEHARAYCEGATEFLRNSCGWSARLVLRDDVKSPLALRQYDGIIARGIRRREYDVLEASGKPVVEAAVKGTGSDHFASVDCDERALAKLAAQHFIERGFVNFAFCGYRGVAFSDMRERYFTEALAERGIRPICYPGVGDSFAEKLIEDTELQEGAFVKWVKGLPQGSGVFCANDVMSHNLLGVCIANGIKVPGELAILGADDDFLLCNVNSPSLSSISLNARGIGIATARLLSKILTGEIKGDIGQLHVSVPPGRLAVRDSTAIYRFGTKWLSDALVFIDREAPKISASDVYRKVHRSHTVVDAAFSMYVATTVQKRIMTVRLKEAKLLLEEGKTAVADIAKSLGFPSVQYFSSTFKLYFNATPAAYKKSRMH